MRSKHINFAFVLLSMTALIISACGSGDAALSGNAGSAPNADATEAAITEAPATEAPATEAVIVVEHNMTPVDFPAEQTYHANDFDSSINADKKLVTSGDRFVLGYFERPFNANGMDHYFQNLDILEASVFDDELWIYAKIVLKGRQADNAGKYALEFDLDRDGKGDWLIVASKPASTDWEMDGVKAYQDANEDVGNFTPMRADANAANGDGFESLVTNDADAVWARISPEDPNTVEIAVKRALLGGPKTYIVSMWAGNALLDPALFDLNDHFSHEQAGAANKDFEIFYPVKLVSEIDNTCRMAVGFTPTALEPGLCGGADGASGIAGNATGGGGDAGDGGDGSRGGCIPSRTAPCP